MRHIRSTLYAIVLAPAVWALCGMGLGREPRFLLLLAAGVAYAILVLAPISPAGPLLAGVALLGASLWALASPSTYGEAWPAASHANLSTPGYGLAALLALPLLGTALNRRRWQQSEQRPGLPVTGTRLGSTDPTPAAAEPAGIAEPVGERTTTLAAPAEQRAGTVRAARADDAGDRLATATWGMEFADDATVMIARAGTATFAVSPSGEVTATDAAAAHSAREPEAARMGGAAAAAAGAETAGPGESTTEQTRPERVAVARTTSGAEAEPAADAQRAAEAELDAQPAAAAEPIPQAEAAPAAAAERAAAGGRATSEDRHAADAAIVKDDDETAGDEASVTTERTEDRRQVIEMLIATRPTQDLSERLANRRNGGGDRGARQVSGPPERAPAEHRDDREVSPAAAADPETTQVIRLPAASDCETTRLIRLRTVPDGEKTQVIRSGSEIPDAFGERTQVLPIVTPRQPSQEPAEPDLTGEHPVEPGGSNEQPAANEIDLGPTERRLPAPMSVVDAEGPDPADDPTTRIRVPRPGERPAEKKVDGSARNQRTMTVLNLERPQDEVADDTRAMRRRPLPAQRRPPEDEGTA